MKIKHGLGHLHLAYTNSGPIMMAPQKVAFTSIEKFVEQLHNVCTMGEMLTYISGANILLIESDRVATHEITHLHTVTIVHLKRNETTGVSVVFSIDFVESTGGNTYRVLKQCAREVPEDVFEVAFCEAILHCLKHEYVSSAAMPIKYSHFYAKAKEAIRNMLT